MNKEKKTVSWTEKKIPSELEQYLSPGTDWSQFDHEYSGEVMDTVLGIWDSWFIVQCSDGYIRRVNINNVKEVKDG